MKHQPPIEIYSIGTELLSGQIQDTNSYWMAQQIAALGGYVRRIAILDDDVDELQSVLADACTRQTRMIITTGGLGPTPDDLTVSVLASILGVDVEVDEELVQHFMKSRDIAKREDVSEGLLKMATKPVQHFIHRHIELLCNCNKKICSYLIWIEIFWLETLLLQADRIYSFRPGSNTQMRLDKVIQC